MTCILPRHPAKMPKCLLGCLLTFEFQLGKSLIKICNVTCYIFYPTHVNPNPSGNLWLYSLNMIRIFPYFTTFPCSHFTQSGCSSPYSGNITLQELHLLVMSPPLPVFPVSAPATLPFLLVLEQARTLSSTQKPLPPDIHKAHSLTNFKSFL